MGDLAIHNGLIYEAQRRIDYSTDNQTSPDQSSSDLWVLKSTMADDVRQLTNSPFGHMGLLDQVSSDVIFLQGFE